MNINVLKYLDALRGSFWFVPMLMAMGALGLAYVMIFLDGVVDEDWLHGQHWAYTGGAEGATATLSTIASSMITIAGVVFSMTLVALTLASSQLGPRLLRSFMTDRTNQFVLGTFVATFLYSLMILRAIRRGDEGDFVPHLSVALAVVLAVASLGVLVYFIHHVAISIQADNIAARIGEELADSIDQLYPEHIGKPVEKTTILPDGFERDAAPLLSEKDGYVQMIDGDALLALAIKHDVVIRIDRRPGHFVVKGGTLASVWPQRSAITPLQDCVNEAFVLGHHRTPVQDIEFAVNQLVEIAVRALSPGINDPFTAVACVDRLSAALARLAQRDTPSVCRHDKANVLRIVTTANVFSDVADSALNQIRQHSRSSAAVSLRLLEAIAVVAPFTHRATDRSTLQRHAEMIASGCSATLTEEHDRRAVSERLGEALKSIDAARSAPSH